jgi:hypothetical protein
MRLLGEWNWWLPGWLGWLPHVTIEGDVDEDEAGIEAPERPGVQTPAPV